MSPELTGIIALVAAVTVESFAQMFLKIGAAGGPGILLAPYRRGIGRLPLSSIAASWVVLGLLAYGLEILLYTFALHLLDVSVAFPLGSLCFVGVALLSKMVLGETVGLIRWLGVGCILAGTVFVAM
jgi:undecaprenyl phosphate-alpha-L-ara4N flippase subunit ArnE